MLRQHAAGIRFQHWRLYEPAGSSKPTEPAGATKPAGPKESGPAGQSEQSRKPVGAAATNRTERSAEPAAEPAGTARQSERARWSGRSRRRPKRKPLVACVASKNPGSGPGFFLYVRDYAMYQARSVSTRRP